jgi:shikimate dehydrogenase
VTSSAAVIGHPISHSLSPFIFKFLAKILNKPEFDYKAMDIPPEALDVFFNSCRDKKGFVGFNVTIPHKEKILQLVDQANVSSRSIGAVNVVSFVDGVATGHNTDIHGLEESFREHDIDLRNQNVVLIGAGGAARAAAFAVGTAGAKNVLIYNRNSKKAENLIRDIGPLFSDTRWTDTNWADGNFKQKHLNTKLIINATPVGMGGQRTTAKEIATFQEILNRHQPSTTENCFAFDLIYHPEKTPFLSEAQKLGFHTVSGLTMLIGQALATWEIWFEEMEADIKKDLKKELKTHLREVLGSQK